MPTTEKKIIQLRSQGNPIQLGYLALSPIQKKELQKELSIKTSLFERRIRYFFNEFNSEQVEIMKKFIYTKLSNLTILAESIKTFKA